MNEVFLCINASKVSIVALKTASAVRIVEPRHAILSETTLMVQVHLSIDLSQQFQAL